jgi:hypothetical protein
MEEEMTRTAELRTTFSVDEEEYCVFFCIDDQQYNLGQTTLLEPGVTYIAIGYSDGTGTIQKEEDLERKLKRLH